MKDMYYEFSEKTFPAWVSENGRIPVDAGIVEKLLLQAKEKNLRLIISFQGRKLSDFKTTGDFIAYVNAY